MNAKDISSDRKDYYSSDSCSLHEFESILAEERPWAEALHAHEIMNGVPIYRAEDARRLLADEPQALLGEWARVFMDGAGVLAITGAFDDLGVIDAATQAYNEIIEAEKQQHSGADHFAASGANDRVWNSLEKLCLHDPETFARYFSNDMFAAASLAWLGPNYQITAQVNQVRPGGKAQTAHRDYHLGFMTAEQAARYPAHVHRLSPVLTLQGAVAHCDMPVESGPTKLLPRSQRYMPGYMAYRLPEFAAHFEENHVQVPLSKGDLLFFNPALFHAAGDNLSPDINRMANLLQVSSAFGVPIETVDKQQTSRAVYPVLTKLGLSDAEIERVIAASAAGYPFPTNLDRDPPVGGLIPASQQQVMQNLLDEGADATQVNERLEAYEWRRQTS